MLDDDPQLGRPGEIDCNQINTLIENNKHYTMREIANKLKISKLIVIGENEKCVFYFMGKTKLTFRPTQHFKTL